MKALFPVVWALCLMFSTPNFASAQWNAAWFQNESVWGDGKAEFTTFDAVQVRYGKPRPSKVIHILVRESLSKQEGVKPEPGSQAAAYPVLKLNQILQIPTGVYVYQQMHSAFWKTSDATLAKATLTSADSCGNTYKEFRALDGAQSWFGSGWRAQWWTYWEGMAHVEETIRPPASGIFYDELPVRVRTLDFAQAKGQISVPIAASIIQSKKDAVAFIPSTIRWTVDDTQIVVEVERGKLLDHFTLDRSAPHGLKLWQQADGGTLTRRHSSRMAYWELNQPGDERHLESTPGTP